MIIGVSSTRRTCRGACGSTDFEEAMGWISSRIRLAHCLQVPDVLRVLADGAIARETGDACDVQDGLLRPLRGFLIEASSPFLGLDVRAKIRHVKVLVSVDDQVVEERAVRVAVSTREAPGNEVIDDA